MAKKKKTDKPSVKKLENNLKAIEDQALLYAKDLAKVFMERKEKDRQLNLTKQQLARSTRIAVLGELAAGIAHEINNILSPALGYVSLLLMEQDNAPKKLLDRLELIERSLAKATSMLQQLLNLSHKKPEKRVLTDIGTIVGNSLALLQFKLKKKWITVEKNLQSDLPKLWVDYVQIEQVFTNLILNAIDAMENGGTLRIATHYHTNKSVKENTYVEIIFEDTGCGIPPEILEKVFEPFYTTKDSGTGLGLFISYGIIEKHGGTIDIKSSPDKGTKFKICLPVP
jgi:signal transduction histidine kinase